MTKPTCAGCAKPVRESAAHIVEHTIDTAKVWHTGCHPVVAAQLVSMRPVRWPDAGC